MGQTLQTPRRPLSPIEKKKYRIESEKHQKLKSNMSAQRRGEAAHTRVSYQMTKGNEKEATKDPELGSLK
jgi:ribosome assembly protein YihI (activator of Der GTPase)